MFHGNVFVRARQFFRRTSKITKFFTINNLMKIIEQSTINGLVSLGLFMAILTAGIDLSVGSIRRPSTTATRRPR